MERTAARAAAVGAGIDEVGDRLGLRDIDFAVEEGALAEFARPSQPAAERQQRR